MLTLTLPIVLAAAAAAAAPPIVTSPGLTVSAVWGSPAGAPVPWAIRGTTQAVAFASAAPRAIVGGDEAAVFEVPSGKRIATLPAENGFGAVALSPRGDVAYTGGYVRNVVTVWDVAHERALRTVEIAKTPGTADGIAAIAVSPDGARIAVAQPSGKVDVLDAASDERLWGVPPDGGAGGQSLSFSADGTRLLNVSGSTHRLVVLRASDGTPEWSVVRDGIESAVFEASGDVVSAGHRPMLARHARATGTVTASLGADDWAPRVAGAGPLFFVATRNALVEAWTFGATSRTALLGGQGDGVPALVASRDGKWLLSGGFHDGVTLWDARTFTQVRAGEESAGWILAVAPIRGTGEVAVASSDGSVLMRTAATGEVVRSAGGRDVPWSAAAFSPDGRTLVAATVAPEHWRDDKYWPSIVVVDTVQGRLGATHRWHNYTDVTVVAADGRSVFTAGAMGMCALWELGAKARAEPLVSPWGEGAGEKPDGRTACPMSRAAAFLGSGRIVLVGGGSTGRPPHDAPGEPSHEGFVAAYDLDARKSLWTEKTSTVATLLAAPDGTAAWIGHARGELARRDLKTHAETWRRTLCARETPETYSDPYSPWVRVAALSKSGKRLAATCGAKLFLLDPQSGAERGFVDLAPIGDAPTSANFDGATLSIGTAAGRVVRVTGSFDSE